MHELSLTSDCHNLQLLWCCLSHLLLNFFGGGSFERRGSILALFVWFPFHVILRAQPFFFSPDAARPYISMGAYTAHYRL